MDTSKLVIKNVIKIKEIHYRSKTEGNKYSRKRKEIVNKVHRKKMAKNYKEEEVV